MTDSEVNLRLTAPITQTISHISATEGSRVFAGIHIYNSTYKDSSAIRRDETDYTNDYA